MDPLELFLYDVDAVAFSDATVFRDGRLSVDVQQAGAFFADAAIARVRLHWASPGDSTRIIKVLDAVQPRAKDRGSPGMFPGLAGPIEGAGRGVTHVLRGVSVVTAGYLPRAQEALAEMSGPGAELSPLGQTHNLVVEFDPAQGAAWEDVEKAMRTGALRLAIYLAEAAIGEAPAHRERLDLKESPSRLPRIGAITNLQTQGTFKDVFVNGASFAGKPPLFIDPNELHDGAVVSGQYGHPSLKNPTVVFQDHPVAAALRAKHGSSLVFAGLVLSPEPVEQSRKESASLAAANLIKEMGWDGAIITKEGGGNADSDISLKMDALHDMGIASVGLFAEMSGPEGQAPPLVSPPERATGMVSTGNYDERILLPAVELALGGERFEVAGLPADAEMVVAVAVIYGSLSPLGWGRLSAQPYLPPLRLPAAKLAGGGARQEQSKIKVVHYVNQFFSGAGGEDTAGAGPARLEQPAPISRKLAALLGEGFEVIATISCGDDYAASQSRAPEEILDLMGADEVDLVIAGPAFSSGRYGVASGKVAALVAAKGIQAIAAMHPENPGMPDSGEALVIAAGETARKMGESLERIAAAANALAAGQVPGPECAVVPTGGRRNTRLPANAADRAVDLLLVRLAGDLAATEIPSLPFPSITPAAPVKDLSTALVALMTEGGLVPMGNPDRLESARATKWLRYPLEPGRNLAEGEFQSVHGGFSTVAANKDPNRILPLDEARQLVESGRIGRLFGEYFVTVGNGSAVSAVSGFGVEWAAELRKAGVEAVILTAT